jgi:hypothetical protein
MHIDCPPPAEGAGSRGDEVTGGGSQMGGGGRFNVRAITISLHRNDYITCDLPCHKKNTNASAL